MIASLSWYLASSLLGWLTFPLVFRLFPALADRGYALARAAGILLWGWVFWILASLGILHNDVGGVLFAIVVLLGLSLWSLTANERSQLADLRDWFVTHKHLVIVTEILFLLAFAFLALVRAANPEAVGTEKPMELAFINAILRSPGFPPIDPWMSGYSISYYHFGYILTAMLTRLTGISGNIAFNLMSALVFALAAIGSYGILYDLLSAYPFKKEEAEETRSLKTGAWLTALLAPLFLLVLSNAEGLLEIFHGMGWFWSGSSTSNFWTWLNIKDLNTAPTGEGWLPARYLWWWRASRVISDTDLVGSFQEVIDEFPAFSFVLGDLHPHVLALPFNMLGIGVALNVFLGGWHGAIRFLGLRLRTTPRDFFFTALVLGGLAFLNTWDILFTAALVVGAYVLLRVREEGWTWACLEDAFLLGIPLAVLSLILYLPFYIGFSSQAGGILPNIVNPTRGAQLWVMWGTLLIPLLVYLVYAATAPGARPRPGTALAWVVGGILLLWAFSWLMGIAAQWRDPGFVTQYLASQNQSGFASLFSAATGLRLSYVGGLLTMALVLWLSLTNLLSISRGDRELDEDLTQTHSSINTSYFVLLAIVIGALLVLVPDFVYIQDLFGYRINTVFKFYYQAWQLWSLAAAFGTAILLGNLRGIWNVLWRILLALVLVTGLVYPILAFANKTNNFKPSTGFSLDASAHLNIYNPDDAAAIHYLQTAPLGVVAEAIGGSYSNYARISTYTGLPAVLGWPWHEYQWRGDWSAHGTREADIKTLYEVPDWETARAILDRYQVRYVVVGSLERTTYNISEGKFQLHLVVLFQAGNTVIYGVP
jgi:YYY domain-containing protein